MIETPEAFVRLRTSQDPAEYGRAAHDEAPIEVWMAVIAGWPDMREWVAHNKTVPLEVLRVLAADPGCRVRRAVAVKRKLDRDLFERLAGDPDEGVLHALAHNAKVPADIRAVVAARLGELAGARLD